jgi:hypothetical protein
MGDPEVIFENKQRGNWGLDSTQPSSVRFESITVISGRTWHLKIKIGFRITTFVLGI